MLSLHNQCDKKTKDTILCKYRACVHCYLNLMKHLQQATAILMAVNLLKALLIFALFLVKLECLIHHHHLHHHHYHQ